MEIGDFLCDSVGEPPLSALGDMLGRDWAFIGPGHQIPGLATRHSFAAARPRGRALEE